jgi:RNA polymerase sigma factor (sigma-70 family)
MTSPSHKTWTDEALWLALKEGDEAAFQTLHHRHYSVLYRYGCKICPNSEQVLDSLQEVFFQLWNKHQTLANVKSVRFYLMKWLKRELVRVMTKATKTPMVDLADEDGLSIALVAEDLLEKGQEDVKRAALLRKAIEQLSPREREVVYMRFFLELTYEEICSALNLSYQVVMNYLSRALKALRTSPFLDKLLFSAWLFLKIVTLHWLVGG